MELSLEREQIAQIFQIDFYMDLNLDHKFDLKNIDLESWFSIDLAIPWWVLRYMDLIRMTNLV